MTPLDLYPFDSSKSLADWAAQHFVARGLDEASNWRMLEYWFQVELFRLAALGSAGNWQHFGNYEQPYHTDLPRSGNKTNTKWIDLVFANPSSTQPRAIVWTELKDIGRNLQRIEDNSKGLGYDLAALWAMSVPKTQDLWLNPKPHSIDRGRLEEWDTLAPHLQYVEQHFIAQVVIAPLELAEVMSPDQITLSWLNAFLRRVGDSAPNPTPKIEYRDTNSFRVYGLVFPLSEESKQDDQNSP